MRVITYSNEGIITRELHFSMLPGGVQVAIFRDRSGTIHALRINEILEIVDE